MLRHVLWSANQYSLEDLIWMKDGRLEKVLAQILEVYLVHITTCEVRTIFTFLRAHLIFTQTDI
jgi:hypothetical protein